MLSFPVDLLSQIMDLQYSRPEIPLQLTRVGVRNLKLSLRIVSKSGTLPLFPVVDIFVDLPSDRRGVHLSRDPESLYEILQTQVTSEVCSIEDFCETVALQLLKKHEYASRAEVRLRSDYVTIRRAPGMEELTQEPCKIFARAAATKGRDKIVTDRTVGVRVTGFTACPCTQGLLKSLIDERLEKLGYGKGEVERIVSKIPLATHTQRTKGTILMQVPVGCSVNLEDLIDIVENSMSGRTYTLLKRPAEASVVEKAYMKAKFTEDVVRDMLWALANTYQNFADETRILVQAYSQESVHKHDIIAERVGTLGEIRSEIDKGE